MLVQRIQEMEEYNIGFLLGKPDIGVRVRRFTNRKIGADYFASNYSLEYYTVEPGKSYPVPNRGCDTIYIIQLGSVAFEGKSNKVFAKMGDIVYTRVGEITSVRNTGTELAEILYCADGQTEKTSNRGL